ncbi:putative pectinesterase 68 [Capsicum baccatum]|uniref:pectinesterase n=1 Tax=Capsicum baccatum TaxID=33114 RepID=A0A2G2XL02_CAPBA|nr:putative pectinesterase 68 [Capsicum baccatum]
MQGWQAMAFRISGDKAYFSGCGFYGAQDTLCDDAGRHYFKECYIEGSINFIFSNGHSVYKPKIEDLQMRTLNLHSWAAVVLGQYFRIVYSYTYFDDIVAHGGWDDWDHVSNKNKTTFFGVYKCSGPGAVAVMSLSWARELDYDSAHKFLAKSFVNGRH